MHKREYSQTGIRTEIRNFGQKKQSHTSICASERSTPQVTVPDMDQESLLSSNWPLHIGSYNREKKLIRDVSYKSEKFR
jgi:hypothetical protein